MNNDQQKPRKSLPNPHPIVIFGVAGCGKSTIAQQVSTTSADVIQFLDADDFHSTESIEKMASGVPLDDQDRAPWLRRLNRELTSNFHSGIKVVLACSALRESHRQLLGEGLTPLWCLLKLDLSQAFLRSAARKNHFFSADMVRSQYKILQVPDYGLHLNALSSPTDITNTILNADQNKS